MKSVMSSQNVCPQRRIQDRELSNQPRYLAMRASDRRVTGMGDRKAKASREILHEGADRLGAVRGAIRNVAVKVLIPSQNNCIVHALAWHSGKLLVSDIEMRKLKMAAFRELQQLSTNSTECILSAMTAQSRRTVKNMSLMLYLSQGSGCLLDIAAAAMAMKLNVRIVTRD